MGRDVHSEGTAGVAALELRERRADGSEYAEALHRQRRRAHREQHTAENLPVYRHSQPACARVGGIAHGSAGQPKRHEPKPLLGVVADRTLEEPDRLTQRALGVAGDVAIDPARIAEHDLVVSTPAA